MKGAIGEDVTAVPRPIDASRRPSQSLHLLYHEVRAVPAEYSYVIDSATFQQHLDLFVHLLGTGPVQPEITFDDGHVSNIEIAAPALEHHRLTARFFITSGWTGNKPGYMNWAQVSTLQQLGHQIGAHGWTHTLLTHCTDAQLEDELNRSRRTIEDKLGVPVTTMSLPGGRANRRVFDACRAAGYEHVFTSAPRIDPSPLPFTVGRINVLGSMQAEWIGQLFELHSPALAKLRRRHRMKDAMKTLLGDRLYEKLWATLNRSELDAITERETAP